jgi:flagellar biosynthesis/type III secretory pathway M-ring protein FliF/YscJ
MKQILNLRKMILIYIILMIISIILFNIIDAKESAYDVLRGYVKDIMMHLVIKH